MISIGATLTYQNYDSIRETNQQKIGLSVPNDEHAEKKMLYYGGLATIALGILGGAIVLKKSLSSESVSQYTNNLENSLEIMEDITDQKE